MRLATGGLVAVTLAAGLGTAMAEVRTVKDIPMALAAEAAAGTVADCAAKGYAVSAAVVDRAGVLRAMQRADNAGPHTVDTSRRKAYTSLTLKASTMAIDERLKANPGSANLIYVNDILILGGGVPIKVGEEVVGAIGVGGAPSGNLDAQCADAGIARIADRLK